MWQSILKDIGFGLARKEVFHFARIAKNSTITDK